MRYAAGIVLFARTSPPQFLLLKHKDRWDLPKGHADDGEDPLTTALRETEEETGIRSSKIEIDHSFEYVVQYEVDHKKYGRYPKRVSYFLGYISQPCPVTLTEHEDYRWCSWPAGPIQAKTIDPLLAAVAKHLGQPQD